MPTLTVPGAALYYEREGAGPGAADDPGGPADHFMTYLSITEAVGGDERPEAN